MTDMTPRFALPLLQPGQAQKEMFHNEAVARLDLVAQASVRSVGTSSPPAGAQPGDCWIVGAAPVGDWAGRESCLAAWTENGWRFVDPVEGMAVWVQDRGLVARHSAGAWRLGEEAVAALSVDGYQVVGARQPAIAAPAGGSAIDNESRATIALILGALRTHGLIAT